MILSVKLQHVSIRSKRYGSVSACFEREVAVMFGICH